MFRFLQLPQSKPAKRILWGTLALFVLSLFLRAVSAEPVLRADGVCQHPHWSQGWEFLLMGPLGVLEGQFGWFANPLMLLAATTRRKVGVAFATLAILLTASTARTLTAFWHEGGPDNVVCGFGPGYYAWTACSALVLIATLASKDGRKRDRGLMVPPTMQGISGEGASAPPHHEVPPTPPRSALAPAAG